MAQRDYVSEATQFIRDYLEKHPETQDIQRKARATWWDRPQDFDERKRLEQTRLPKKPYEYY